MGRYFGTDGFRGEANIDVTADHAFKVGRFLGWYFGREHKAKIVIGKDARRSSYMFEYALAAGLTASGADAYLLHVTTTPSVSYVVRSEDFDCGIMVSASHNPYYDNGIKVIDGSGFKMDVEVEGQIEDYLDGLLPEIPFARRGDIGKTVDYAMGRHRYIGFLISLATRSFNNLHIGLDMANGSATTVAKGVFDALGAKTYCIGNEPDGLNINDNCGSTHVERLRELVLEKHLDVGFAFDGDADRCIAVDERGNVLSGDFILYACGCYMKERGELSQDKIVTTVMSNMGLLEALRKKGISYEITPVGDKYVSQCMKENGYSLGGEDSGHIIFSKHAVTGDGVLTALKLMEAMLEKKAKLSSLSDELFVYPSLLLNVRVKDKSAARADEGVKSAEAQAQQTLGDDGRLLLRESGTEPVVRILAEAKTKELCDGAVETVRAALEIGGHIIK